MFVPIPGRSIALWLLFSLSAFSAASCPAPAPPPPRRALSPTDTTSPGRVDCPAYCGRLYLCFDAFLSTADPKGGAARLRDLREAGAYDQARRTLLGACQGECRRAHYQGAAARVVNGCLRTPTCPAFGRCVMDRIYTVRCEALCHRAWITCLPAVLKLTKGLSKQAFDVLRRRGRLSQIAATEYTQCMVECRTRSGHGPGALGLNLCLTKPRCPTFASCLQGLLGPRKASARDCVRLYDRFLRCRRIPVTRGAFLDICLRLRKRPHMQADLHCALHESCTDFERCLREVPRPRTPAPRRAATPHRITSVRAHAVPPPRAAPPSGATPSIHTPPASPPAVRP